MTLRLYTFRGKHTGKIYYATGLTQAEAARQINIRPKHLILERSEVIPPEGVQLVQDPSISSHTARYGQPPK